MQFPRIQCPLKYFFVVVALLSTFISIFLYPLIKFFLEKSSADNREFVEAVTAHELAHQWFGNTVTMDWWSG